MGMIMTSAPNVKIPILGDWFWNSVTKKLEDVEGKVLEPYTFERPWSTNLGLGFSWRPLNPMLYPTLDTAKAVLDWAKKTFPNKKFRIGETYVMSPGVVTLDPGNPVNYPMYQITLVDPSGDENEFSAGLLAFGIMKNGAARAKESFKAEMDRLNNPWG